MMDFDFNTVQREEDGTFTVWHKTANHAIGIKQDYPIELWDSPEAFAHAGVHGYEPMTAKELDTEETQNKALNDTTNFIEEKFDGTRAIMQFFSYENCEGIKFGYARIFSRRISNKTGHDKPIVQIFVQRSAIHHKTSR